MKLVLNKLILLTACSLLATSTVFASSTTKKKAVQQQQDQSSDEIDAKDIDGLGGNEALMKMANNIDPNNKSRIVQKRTVDRNDRFELGVNYGNVFGGDSYLQTQSLGGNVDFHFNPHWSVGVHYLNYGNQLTPEGQRTFQDAQAAYAAGGRTFAVPDIDYPLQSAMAIVNWYPIYGKVNMFDMGIVQFDMYLLGGGGQIQLSSGWTSTYTGGLGVAMWLSQRFSARAEVKYQTYQDQIITGPRTINATVGTIGLGFLL